MSGCVMFRPPGTLGPEVLGGRVDIEGLGSLWWGRVEGIYSGQKWVGVGARAGGGVWAHRGGAEGGSDVPARGVI